MSDNGWETESQKQERRFAAAMLAAMAMCCVVFVAGNIVYEANQPERPAVPLVVKTEGSSGLIAEHLVPRSGKWPAVRRAYLAKHPDCQACGRTEKQSGQAIECHHVVEFSRDSSKELDPDNLISLCRRCHEIFGHLDRWSSFNESVREDADNMLKKIKNRP